MEGKPGSRPSKKPPAPAGRADWDTVRQTVEAWCDSIRVNKEPWDNLPADVIYAVCERAGCAEVLEDLRGA